MIVGITKEIKTGENRVSMTPFGVRELVRRGHRVLVEKAAGMGSGFPDEQFAAAGARLIASARQVWEEADMIVKVKEPVPDEYAQFREGLTLFTYLHLAADRSLTEHLLKEKVTGIAYETVELADGSLPLLRPMSEVAGRIGAQEAANLLASHRGGKGVLMGGIPGVSPARVVVLGGGASGLHAARVCLGLGAQVTIFDVDLERLRHLDQVLDGIVHYCVANIPSAMPRTSTQALSNATLPYVLKLADRGIGELMEREGPFRGGLNTFCGALTNERVAHAHGTGAGPENSMTP
jgi:alanine dehydrogenase